MKLKQKVLIGAIFLLILANFFVWQEILQDSPYLEVVFFDIGQGDASFIETPSGLQILIDGGPSGKRILEKLSQVMPFWDHSLDAIILTHPDADHLSGLNWVLKRYKVENILWTGVKKDSRTFHNWEKNLEKEAKDGARVVLAREGTVLKIGEARVAILYPFRGSGIGPQTKATNDTSVVAKLIHGNVDVLFAGDISSVAERKLIKSKLVLKSDVLKVAHHGSKTSTSWNFIQSVAPIIAAISVSKNNPYGHPSKEVLKRLTEYGTSILITYRDGDIRIISDGKNFGVETEKRKLIR